MKKRSTGADGANLRQVVVEQPKMVKKQVEIDDTLGEEEQRSNKSSILDASRDGGVRRRGGSSMAGTDMMDEINDILRDEDGSSLGGREEEAVEAVIEFGRAGAWWGCCCRDLNRLLLKIKTKCLFVDNRNQVCFFHTLLHMSRPWPPMWRPVKVHPGDEDDEELDSAMMVLNKEWDEVEDDKATTLWNDIKRCFTIVRN